MVIALASGATIDQAADAGNLSRRTINRRLQEPSFRAEVLAARERLLERALGVASALAVEAVETLAAVMRDTEAAAPARVSAARAVLEHLLRAREQGELSARIAVLEETLRTRGGGFAPLREIQR